MKDTKLNTQVSTVYAIHIKRWFEEFYYYCKDKEYIESRIPAIIEALDYDYQDYKEREIALKYAAFDLGKRHSFLEDENGRKYLEPIKDNGDPYLFKGGYVEIVKELVE